LTATPGPPRWMPAACTRQRTPSAPPPHRSGRRCRPGCPPVRPCRCCVDGGYDSAQLTLDLAQQRATVPVRRRSDRCFDADPPPAARSPKGGRPRRHGARFNCADPATWPTRPPPWPQTARRHLPTIRLVWADAGYAGKLVTWTAEVLTLAVRIVATTGRPPLRGPAPAAGSWSAPSPGSAVPSTGRRLRTQARTSPGVGAVGDGARDGQWPSPTGTPRPTRALSLAA
jgi:hypothetical protein